MDSYVLFTVLLCFYQKQTRLRLRFCLLTFEITKTLVPYMYWTCLLNVIQLYSKFSFTTILITLLEHECIVMHAWINTILYKCVYCIIVYMKSIYFLINIQKMPDLIPCIDFCHVKMILQSVTWPRTLIMLMNIKPHYLFIISF